MTKCWQSALVVSLLGVSLFDAAPALAQDRSIELGIDAGVTSRLEEPRITSISVPAQRFRAGFFVSDVLSIEPSLFLQHQRRSGISLSVYMVDLGVLWHFAEAPGSPGPYVRPFAGILGVGGSGTSGDADFSVGFGAGTKGPLADRLFWRAEANVRRQFTSDDVDPDETSIGLTIGLSFFTR